jgi:molybdate/tungstate transport system substrate-binding protein
LRRAYVALALVVIVVLGSVSAFLLSQRKTALTVMCAESLMFPMVRVAQSFEASNPNVDVKLEGYGSIQVIRQVTEPELGQKADVLMVADCSLIPTMMYNTTMPNSNESYANWYVQFSTSSIVLAYTIHSKYADEINATNWYSVLARPDVGFGFPNPMVDALGYRALITIQLANTHYNDSNIFHSLITQNFGPPISSIASQSGYTIFVPDVQQPKSNKILLMDSGIKLIPLLEAGDIDYCFLYLSSAKQYELPYVQLPDEINLGNPQYESYYRQVQVTFGYQRFATIAPDRDGDTIYFGLTIPNNAPHPDFAVEFIKYVLSGGGKQIFASCSQPVFSPSFTDNIKALPADLRPFVVVEP